MRRLGASGPEIGAVAYGCWRLTDGDVAATRARIETALDHGLTLIDTADVYGLDFAGQGFGAAEEQLGAVLAEAPALRERMVLTTKGGIRPPVPYDSSAEQLVAACEASLRRLRVDHVDLWQVHRPDVLTHPAEVAAALTHLRETGKAREVGVSNHSPTQLDALQACLAFPLVSTQPELSLLRQDAIDDGTLDQCTVRGILPLAWSPLAGGALVDRPADDGLARTLDELAAREGSDRAGIALAWVMAHPSAPVPIVGTQRPERIAAAAAATQVRLDRADWYRLAAAAGRHLP